MPQNVITLQNAPAAPDPQGMSAMAGLLGKSDLFKDAMGLEGTQKLTAEAMKNALAAAQSGQQNAGDMARMAQQYILNKQAMKDKLISPKTAAENIDKINKEGAKTQGERRKETYQMAMDAVQQNPHTTPDRKSVV